LYAHKNKIKKSTVGAIHESIVVQIRILVVCKATLKRAKTPLLFEGGVPEGRGGFYIFAGSEFLHKPPRLLASLAASEASHRPLGRRGVFTRFTVA
jgi:hypothetical protein